MMYHGLWTNYPASAIIILDFQSFIDQAGHIPKRNEQNVMQDQPNLVCAQKAEFKTNVKYI